MRICKENPDGLSVEVLMQCEYGVTTRSRLQMIAYHLLYSVLQPMVETPALNRLAQS